MKKLFLILAVSSILFIISGCTSTTSGTSDTTDKTSGTSGTTENGTSDKTPGTSQTTKKMFAGFEDKDGKSVDGTINSALYKRNGKTITYTADKVSGNGLESVINGLSTGDTLILDGSKGIFNLTTTRIYKSGITIKGTNNAILDFTATNPYTESEINAAIEGVRTQSKTGTHYLKDYDSAMAYTLGNGRGFSITAEYVIIENLIFQNAADNGLFIGPSGSSNNSCTGGSYNIIRNCEARFNGDSGFQISGKGTTATDCGNDYVPNGPHDNKFFNCYSHDNRDLWNLGENADGFAVKAGAGDGNYFENCTAEYNADDGWDCYQIRGSCTWVNCKANYNGWSSETKKDWGEFSNGNGFKVGGGKTDLKEPQTHKHAQYLKDCSAVGNRGNSGVGFDRNNQYGSVYLSNCYATDNQADIERNGSYRKNNYSMGSYGNEIFTEKCYVGKDSEIITFPNGNKTEVK